MNKYSKFIKTNLSHYKLLIKPEYLSLYDELTSKYINREIVYKSQITKLVKQLSKRPSLVKKKFDKVIKKDVKKYHLSSTIVVRTIWYKLKGNNGTIDDKEARLLTKIWIKYGDDMSKISSSIKSKIACKIYYDEMEYSLPVFNSNIALGIKLFKDEIINDFLSSDQYKRVDCIQIGKIRVVDESTLKIINKKKCL